MWLNWSSTVLIHTKWAISDATDRILEFWLQIPVHCSMVWDSPGPGPFGRVTLGQKKMVCTSLSKILTISKNSQTNMLLLIVGQLRYPEVLTELCSFTVFLQWRAWGTQPLLSFLKNQPIRTCVRSWRVWLWKLANMTAMDQSFIVASNSWWKWRALHSFTIKVKTQAHHCAPSLTPGSVISAQADVLAKNLTKIGKILQIFDKLDEIKIWWVLCQS